MGGRIPRLVRTRGYINYSDPKIDRNTTVISLVKCIGNCFYAFGDLYKYIYICILVYIYIYITIIYSSRVTLQIAAAKPRHLSGPLYVGTSVWSWYAFFKLRMDPFCHCLMQQMPILYPQTLKRKIETCPRRNLSEQSRGELTGTAPIVAVYGHTMWLKKPFQKKSQTPQQQHIACVVFQGCVCVCVYIYV